MQDRIHGRYHAIDYRPDVLFDTAVAALDGVAFTGSNFGFLLEKKTASPDKINVQYAKYTTGTSQYIDFTASGSAKLCSDTLTQNSVTGGLGYHCIVPSGWPLLYWVDHKTGDANYLGLFGRSGEMGRTDFRADTATAATRLGERRRRRRRLSIAGPRITRHRRNRSLSRVP